MKLNDAPEFSLLEGYKRAFCVSALLSHFTLCCYFDFCVYYARQVFLPTMVWNKGAEWCLALRDKYNQILKKII